MINKGSKHTEWKKGSRKVLRICRGLEILYALIKEFFASADSILNTEATVSTDAVETVNAQRTSDITAAATLSDDTEGMSADNISYSGAQAKVDTNAVETVKARQRAARLWLAT